METAVFAGGCFWGMEDLIRRIPGVHKTRVGYTGGHVDNPTYRLVCTKTTGHAEAVEIEFDPSVVSYRKLLEFFFQIHDPTTIDRQGNDIGDSYRSEIFYTNDAQKEMAVKTIEDVNASGLWPAPVVTKCRLRLHFGRQNQNIRIIWCVIRTAIPVTSPVRIGFCRAWAQKTR